MQQSSATPKNQRCVRTGLRKIVACSQSPRSVFLFLARCHPYILLHFYACSTHFFSHKYGQHAVGSLASLVHECGDLLLRMPDIRTKWRLIHPETPVELSVSLFDSLAEFICSKGSSSDYYRVDWCRNHQTNSSLGVMKKKKKKKMENNLW